MVTRPVLPDGRQGVTIELAVGVLGYGVDEDHGRRNLEGDELRATVLDERGFAGASSGARRHESHRHLAVDVVAHGERAGVGDVRMLEQAVGNLERGDVDAALDDDVLLAAGDVDVALVVPARQIAVAKAVLGNRHELVRALPVRGGELPPVDDHLALFARRKLAAGVVEDAHAHVERGLPDRAELAAPWMVTAHEARLGAAGELDDLDPVALLELQVLVDRERRGRRGHLAQRRQPPRATRVPYATHYR